MSLASEMVLIIQEKLKQNAGVSSLTTDGTSISFDREQLLKELDMWQRKADVVKGNRRRVLGRSIDISGAF